MTAIEIKANILDAVAREENIEKLSLLHSFVLRYFRNNVEDSSEEPQWLLDDLEKALEEVALPENTISHQEALKLMEAWKRKKLSGAK